jgi:hypothetical protein
VAEQRTFDQQQRPPVLALKAEAEVSESAISRKRMSEVVWLGTACVVAVVGADCAVRGSAAAEGVQR